MTDNTTLPPNDTLPVIEAELVPVVDLAPHAPDPFLEEPERSNIIHAEEQFNHPGNPTRVFTREELVALGVQIATRENQHIVTIPVDVQKQIISTTSTAEQTQAVLAGVLKAVGFDGVVKYHVDPASLSWTAWQAVTKKAEAAQEAASPSDTSPSNSSSASVVEATIAERGKVYGDPELSHENIGLAWTGLVQQHYQCRFDHPFPAWLVELMMVQFKAHRSSRVYHADNFVDLAAYAKFAHDHQKAAFTALPAEKFPGEAGVAQ